MASNSVITLPTAPDGYSWSEIARAGSIAEAQQIIPQYEQSFYEGEQSVMTLDFGVDILAGGFANLVNLLHNGLQAAGISLWGNTEAIGSVVYVYGQTTMPWLAAALIVIASSIFALSLAITAISLWRLVQKVAGLIPPDAMPIVFIVGAFLVIKLFRGSG